MPQLERTLNEGLNGEEIVMAVLDKIDGLLRHDCPKLAKRGQERPFEALVMVDLELDDVPGTKNVQREITHKIGSGVETADAIAAIKGQVGSVLRRDCYLNKTTNWRAIRIKINVELRIEEEDPIETQLVVENQPPNMLRVETGQKVPTEVTGKDGRKKVVGVEYDRKDAKRAMSKATK